MQLSLIRFYWLCLAGAILALTFSLVYLAGAEIPALGGFALIAAVAIYITIRINRGDMPSICDLCGADAVMTAEYGTGFSNARLIVTCPGCGRVINTGKGTVTPQREKR